MTINFEAGVFSSTSTGSALEAKQLFEHLSWKIASVSLENASLLVQGGLLIAPIFVFQVSPGRNKPWWTIGIVQYHSIRGNLSYCKVNVWGFISTKSMLGEDITRQILPVDPWSDGSGLRSRDFKIRFNYSPYFIYRQTLGVKVDRPLSLTENKRLPRDDKKQLTRDLVGGSYGLLEEHQIRDDYPKVDIGTFLEEISQEYTLESELKKLLGEE